MKTFRWRIYLPVFNLLLAIGLSAVGVRQYEEIRYRFQGHGRMFYVPPAQLVVDSLNVLPFVLSNVSTIASCGGVLSGNGSVSTE